MIYRILALIYKEFLALLKDKKGRIVLFVPPLLQLFLFSYAATLEVKNVSIGVVNHDFSGRYSHEIIQRLQGAKLFSTITFLPSLSEVRSFIDEKKGIAVIYIDSQFSKNIALKKKEDLSLHVILDGRKSHIAQIVTSYISSIAASYNRELSTQKRESLSGSIIEPTSQNWYNPNLLYNWYTVPCLCGILTMVQGLVITAMSIVREREFGTFDQLLVSPIRPIEILIGKSVPAIVVALISGSFILCMSIFFFFIPFTGSLIGFYTCMLVFITSIVGVGLFISSLCTTQQQAVLGSFIFMSPSISLSGFATPIENMPIWLQKITLLLPLRYFLIVIKGCFLKAMPLKIALQYCFPMIIIAFFTLSGALFFFRKKVG